MNAARALAIACALAALQRSAAARPLVVMPPWSGLAVLLFPEELETVRDAVREFIASHRELDFEIVPREKLAPLERRVLDGRLRDGGPRCADPPRLEDVLETEHPNALRAWTNLDCGKGGCTLDVIVHSSNPRELEEWIWSAPVDAAALPRDWLRAVAKLAPVKAVSPPGFTYRSGVAPPTVRAVAMNYAGGWRSTPQGRLAAAQKALDACHDASKRYHAHYYVTLIKVRQDGSVARLHVAHEPDEPAEACVTAALRPLDFERGAAARRVRVAVVDDGLPIVLSDARYGVSATIDRVRAGGGYSLDEKLPLAELRACYADAGLVVSRRFEVALDVEESGHVAAARIEPPGARDTGLRACLEQALLHSRLPCSADGKPATARFQLALDPYVLPVEEKAADPAE